MRGHFSGAPLLVFLGMVVFAPPLNAAAPSSTLLRAKQDAEVRGFLFVTDRAEIVAKAQKEGRLRVITSMEPETAKASVAAFKKRYPFIDLNVHARTGSESAQQLVLQIKSGTAGNEWDVVSTSSDLINDYIPHLWKVDLQEMAQQGVLQIPHQMVDSTQRNIVAFHSRFQVVANKNLVPPTHVPKVWEDLLKAEFKGRKFSLDIRPGGITTLIPAWGLDKTIEFARRLASQDPIWVKGDPRAITGMLAGEIPMMVAANFHDLKRAQKNDGGETNLHAHTGMDAIWVVLQGEATFYGQGDKVVGKLKKHQAILIPRPNPYWFESSGAEPLVILHVMAYQPGAVAKRIDYTQRKELPREMVEGKFFGQENNM